MTREDAEHYEALLMKQVVERRALGGFDANAPAVQQLSEVMLEIIRHIKESMPRPKKTEEKKK